MSSAAGLSRRRGGGGSTFNSSTLDDDAPNSGESSPRPRLNGGNSNAGSFSAAGGGGGRGTSHAGSAFEGGSKIAYDPRDLEDVDAEERKVGGKMPKLTIMEEILLLGIKDKQGYLSFWNDNISYALRGCILIELALRRRIALVRDPNSIRRGVALSERLVEVIDDRMTGETILDETLRMMKAQQDPPGAPGGSTSSGGYAGGGGGGGYSGGGGGEKLGVNNWVDLLSGETWNVLKIGFQLKQVRERLAKGLVDKGVLRTEKRNFLLFDMATHPVADTKTKADIIRRVLSTLTATTSTVPSSALLEEGTQCRVLRSVCLVCAAYTASVLDNAFGGGGGGSVGALGYEEREAAFARADEILAEFSCWPFGSGLGDGGSTPASRKRQGSRIATGSSGDPGRESVLGLVMEAKKEMGSGLGSGGDDGEDLGFELIAGVLEVLSKLDSLL